MGEKERGRERERARVRGKYKGALSASERDESADIFNCK